MNSSTAVNPRFGRGEHPGIPAGSFSSLPENGPSSMLVFL